MAHIANERELTQMKNSMANAKFIHIAVIAFASTLMPALSSAEPSPARKDLGTRSIAKSFTASRLPILVRKPGIGNDAMADKLRAVLTAKLGINTADYQRSLGPKGLTLQGADWSMKVSDEGNAARVRIVGDRRISVPATAQPSYNQIETAGRDVLNNVLSDFVVLAPNEALVPLRTRFIHSAGHDLHAGTHEPTQTKEWSMAFGRSIDGEVVVGGGAIVGLIFRADGSLAGFDLDWPKYESSPTSVDTLDVGAIRARGRGFEKSNGYPPQSRELRFECGFFDPGGKSPRRRLQYVQPACFQMYVTPAGGKPGNVEESAIGIAIPGARAPLNDAKWPETAIVCSQPGAACRTAP
jgi:hypothetical protein